MDLEEHLCEKLKLYSKMLTMGWESIQLNEFITSAPFNTPKCPP